MFSWSETVPIVSLKSKDKTSVNAYKERRSFSKYMNWGFIFSKLNFTWYKKHFLWLSIFNQMCDCYKLKIVLCSIYKRNTQFYIITAIFFMYQEGLQNRKSLFFFGKFTHLDPLSLTLGMGQHSLVIFFKFLGTKL